MRFNMKTAAVAGGLALLPKILDTIERVSQKETFPTESMESFQATTKAMSDAADTIEELQRINASNVAEYNTLKQAHETLLKKYKKLQLKHKETQQMASFVADCSEAYRIEAERLTKENVRLVAENKDYERYSTALSDKIFDLKVELGYTEF